MCKEIPYKITGIFLGRFSKNSICPKKSKLNLKTLKLYLKMLKLNLKTKKFLYFANVMPVAKY